ncbi:MAG: hydroxyacid dehydrogenase [Clostridia bacterium]|nr:hydroxyacid dehydrogenase [Clostridia bacterium]
MKIVFLDALTLGNDIDLSGFSELGEVVIYGGSTNAEVIERTRDCDVVVTNKLKLNESNLSLAHNLKLICVTATGFDNIDVNYAKSRGIGVCNVVGYSTSNVAQITVGMVLDLINRTDDYRASVKSGEYSARGVANVLSPTYHEIEGKTWGIVGFGNIGRRVARIADALGCRVLVNKREPISDFECVDIDTLCKECDIITLHTPLNDGTRGLISSERIAAMKEGVILVNVARGAVVDENAVANAFKIGKLGGFGCDVYSAEPFGKDHPYYEIKDMDNVILTPHMAWGSYEARLRLCNEVKENIIAFFKGDIKNRIDV